MSTIQSDPDLLQVALDVLLIPNEDVRASAIQAACNLYGNAFLIAYRDLSGEEEEVDPTEQEALTYQKRFQAFTERFFPHFCTAPFSRMHLEFFEEFDDTFGHRDLRCATAAPRGNAKTTIRSVIKTIYDVCFGLEDFILLMSSRHTPLALDKVRGIRDELELNRELKYFYGYQGSFVTQDWSQSDFIARNRWGHEVRIVAGSPKSQIRGFLWRGLRPTKVILDDIENSEHVVNEDQRVKMETWLVSDVAKLGTMNPRAKRLNIDFVGTILHEDSLLSKQLSNPGYRARRYQSVSNFAYRTDLWAQWRDLFINLEDPDRVETARAFFEAHQQEMLEGADVLWPDGDPYYDLMISRLTEGEAAFWQEKQNYPQQSGNFPFKMDMAAYVTIKPDRIERSDGTFVLFRDITDVVAFWDPTPGDAVSANPDFSACVIAMGDYHGYIYIVDAYMAQYDSSTTQCEEVALLLADWGVSRAGLETNAFQSLLTRNLREAIFELRHEYPNWAVDIHPIRQHVNKEKRIYSLEPLIANKWVQFSDRLPDAYRHQMANWLPIKDSGKDDGPDATEGAIRVLRYLRDNRSAF